MGFFKATTVAVPVAVTVFLTRLLILVVGDPQEFLATHNAVRATVGVPPLSWSADVADYALQYAHTQIGQCRSLRHSRGPYGENLFWGSGKDWTGEEAVTMWADEVEYYDYETNSCTSGQMCGHYTQVVWNSTTHVGCASVQCYDDAKLIICSYDPPGNWIGERPY